MRINTPTNNPATLGGEQIQEVESFTCPASFIDKQGGTDSNILRGSRREDGLQTPESGTLRQNARDWESAGERQKTAQSRLQWRSVVNGLCSTGSDGS